MERFDYFQALSACRTSPSPLGRASPTASGPRIRIPQLAPDLVVEVLSKSNTKPRNGQEAGGVFRGRREGRSGWSTLGSGRCESTRPSTNPSCSMKDQTLDGGAVLPGFVLRLDELFADDEP